MIRGALLFSSVAVTVLAGGCRPQVPPAEPEAKPSEPVYESSIGGVVTARSDLTGEAAKGYLVFSKWCSGCHAPEFTLADKDANDKLPIASRLPLGTNLLQQRYKGSVPAALEQRTDLTPEAVSYFVRHGLNAMPGYRKTEISDGELASLSAYLTRNNTPAQ